MSSRTRRKARAHRGRGLVRALRGAVLVGALSLALVLVGAVSAYGVLQSWLEDLPDYESPEAFEVARATKIYSADGVLLARLYLENRTVVPRSRIATDLADAIVAIEDERFYEHDGIDYIGIARAAVVDIVTGSLEEGASTITQQYVDNTLLRDERTLRTFEYKAREAYLALELEKRKTKDEILELYLNTIYLGEGSYGVEAASQVYFSKSAIELSLPEAATIAALAQAPSRLNPYTNPEGATSRRNLVLSRMLDNGYITADEYEAAKTAPIVLERAPEPEHGIYRAHYFVAHVKKLLQQEFSQALVFQGGLEVHTTLDTKIQAMAENSVQSNLGRPTDPDVALVSLDPRNGYIKAMYGGRDYSANKFNLATQGRRQPGSSFKMFVLVTALENGMPPNRYISAPSRVTIPSNPPWTVAGGGGGKITMQSATRASVNTAFANLIWELNDDESTGAEKVAQTARRMGITSDVPAFYSIALGAHNVSPLDMASAYGTLATNGTHFAPLAITKVMDPAGDVVFEAEPSGTEVLEPGVAYAATSILEGVINGGTGTRARIGRPAAGKTGTSQDYRDAWFCGYTPQLSTSVWVGYYDKEVPMTSVNGVRGFGGTLAAPIWASFMKQALANEPVLDFVKQPAPEYTWKPEWSPNNKIPAVVGMAQTDAQNSLADGGFNIAIAYRYDLYAPSGIVVGQSPGGGSEAKPGDTVTIYISKGQEPAPPPTPPTPDTTPTP